jgi:hypothetical protein
METEEFDKLDKSRENDFNSLRREMETRLEAIDLEHSKMKAEEECQKKELELYKQHYIEECQIRASLSDEINR